MSDSVEQQIKDLQKLIQEYRDEIIRIYAETYEDYARSKEPRMISEIGWIDKQLRKLNNYMCDLEDLYNKLYTLNPDLRWK